MLNVEYLHVLLQVSGCVWERAWPGWNCSCFWRPCCRGLCSKLRRAWHLFPKKVSLGSLRDQCLTNCVPLSTNSSKVTSPTCEQNSSELHTLHANYSSVKSHSLRKKYGEEVKRWGILLTYFMYCCVNKINKIWLQQIRGSTQHNTLKSMGGPSELLKYRF